MFVDDREGCLSVRAMVFVNRPKANSEDFTMTYPKRFTVERVYPSRLEEAAQRVTGWREANPGLEILGTFTVTL